MNRSLRRIIVGLSVGCACVAAAAPAMAAAGGGAETIPTTCEVELPGDLGTVSGTGSIKLRPNGNQTVKCNVELPSQGPGRAVHFGAGDCDAIVTPARVLVHCG